VTQPSSDVRWLDRDGVRIAYEVRPGPASAVPLLLSHGYSASKAMWRPNLDALSAARTVITWDMRGHGETEAPDDIAAYSHALTVDDMRALLDECDVPAAAVGGLSLGGFMSLDFYRSHPDRVHCLLLFDTGPGFKKDASRQGWNDNALATADRYKGGGLSLAARGMLVQQDAGVILSLPDVAVPTLVLVGANDSGFLAAADYMTATIPKAEKAVIPDAGHSANIDQPEAFNAAVTDFLSRYA